MISRMRRNVLMSGLVGKSEIAGADFTLCTCAGASDHRR